MKIVLADDHPLFREGVRHVLSKLSGQAEIIDVHDYPSLFDQAERHPDLDMALVDLNMPGMDGHEAVSQFRQAFPQIPLVIISASEARADMIRSLDAGALGYIPKSSSSQIILEALEQVLAGGLYRPPGLEDPCPEEDALAHIPGLPHLTCRQLSVLKRLVEGKTNRIISQELGLSEGTVKIHMSAILRALKASNRVEAMLAARKLGLDVNALSRLEDAGKSG